MNDSQLTLAIFAMFFATAFICIGGVGGAFGSAIMGIAWVFIFSAGESKGK